MLRNIIEHILQFYKILSSQQNKKIKKYDRFNLFSEAFTSDSTDEIEVLYHPNKKLHGSKEEKTSQPSLHLIRHL